MSKEKFFKELIAELVSSGEISGSAYSILLMKGEELGLTKTAVDLLIKLEQGQNTDKEASVGEPKAEVAGAGKKQPESFFDNSEYEFTSAITRGGSILTPDKIIVSATSVPFKKRNKYLINTDTISIPIKNVASIEIDTSILGSDIIIKSYGAGRIEGKKFTKTDALEIKRLIEQRQASLK